MKHEPIVQYEMLYALRRSIPVEWVRQNERLALASFLEWEIVTGTLTVYEARKKYVSNYPESNRLAVSRTLVELYVGGKYTKEDKNYAHGSVLEMVKPYDNCERELETLLDKL